MRTLQDQERDLIARIREASLNAMNDERVAAMMAKLTRLQDLIATRGAKQ